MSRTFTLVSICIHATVLGCVYVAQAVSIGPLPIPREALAFNERLVKIADIALPAPPRRSAASPPSASPRAAPLVAPPSVTPETGRELEAIAPAAGDPAGADGGSDARDFGVIPGVPLVQPPPPTPPARQAIRLHSGIQPPRKILDVTPSYPTLARAARQEGVVILETVIDMTGAVEAVRVLKGYPLLDQAAVDAVRRWRFTPALLNGQPVPVVMTVTVNFTLQR